MGRWRHCRSVSIAVVHCVVRHVHHSAAAAAAPSLPLSPSLVMLMGSATDNAQLQPMIGWLACADADEDLHVSLRVLPPL